ncbi:MAG TPA: hypothetical protein VFD82_00620 [Planctomycetota bacterium]|nr:hypothetical protein [Planctomycetota bacterium]
MRGRWLVAVKDAAKQSSCSQSGLLVRFRTDAKTRDMNRRCARNCSRRDFAAVAWLCLVFGAGGSGTFALTVPSLPALERERSCTATIELP